MPVVRVVEEKGKWHAYANFRSVELAYAKADTREKALQELAERLTARLANVWYAWHDPQK